MREVLLTDIGLWAALIMLAAWIIVRRWRASHSWVPARGPREEPRELAGPKTPELAGPSTRELAGPNARELAGPNARELAGPKMAPPKTARVTGPGRDPRVPDRAAPRPARPAPVAPPRAIDMARPKARPHRPAARRDGQQTPARAATPSERIVSYFDQADQPIADYLAALGWTQQPSAPAVRRQAQIRVLPQNSKTARPAP